MEGDSACLVAVQVCLHLDADMFRDVLLSAESSTQRQHLPGFPALDLAPRMAAGSPVKTSELPLDLVSPAVEVDAPLDDRDIELVQTTFAKVAAVGPEAAGRILFGHIFRIAPEAKGLFSFAKDEETMWLPGSRLEKHGARVVTTVGTAVSLLKDLDTLVPVLQKLGLQHVGYNVLPVHYDVVGQAFIATLEDALQAEFTEAVKNAYVKVWNVVQTTMIGDNYTTSFSYCVIA